MKTTRVQSIQQKMFLRSHQYKTYFKNKLLSKLSTIPKPAASSIYRYLNKGTCNYFFGQGNDLNSPKSLADSINLFFIHVPKAAGMSISSALYSGSQIGHWRSSEIFYILGTNTATSYRYVTVVRNPFDRLYSAYSFLRRGGITKLDTLLSEVNSDIFSSFPAFVKTLYKSPLLRCQLHLVSQFDFINLYGSLDHFSLIGKVEKINEFASNLSFLIEKPLLLQKINNNPSKPPYDRKVVYDTSSADITRELYDKDFDLFDYSYEL